MSDEPRDTISYRQVIGGLLEDGEQFAKAKVRLYRAIVFYRFSQARKSALLFFFATVIAAAAFVALLMALVFSLAQIVGPFLAGLIVFGVGIAVAAGLAYWGMQVFPDLDEKLFTEDEFDFAPPLSTGSSIEPSHVEEDVDT